MPGGTLQILGLGTSPVPLDYVVAPSQVFDLIAAQADFDGSGAGVDFVPVVQIISDAGEIMAQGVGPTITAGSSASVTFAPFLRQASSAGAGTVTHVTSSDGSIAVSGPFGPTVDVIAFTPRFETGLGVVLAAGGGGTNIPFHNTGGSSLFDYTTATAPKPKQNGWYQFTFQTGVGGVPIAGSNVNAQAIINRVPGPSFPTLLATNTASGVSDVETELVVVTTHMTTADSFTVTLGFTDPANQDLTCQFYAVLVRP